ncbi:MULTISPECIES: DUF6275 family protein [Leuconostoc]|uniref:DUF6275 family protein n=1 Tax=Leuconostoc TaxID=1243 RepID=UPI0035CFC226|nr:hypothetical protein [Leuconostoc mesenteroides]MCT3078273.1 hypothetical protein [Leuconostoc citreum]MCT3080430.1 hypothetical protein [Leuconostoc citreum]MCT3082857.1 hypothetical protein [Leuconostoc citreum]
MDKSFMSFVEEKIAEQLGCKKEEVYMVWQCKTLQNIKGLFSSDVPQANGLYYEATYNGDKGEIYLDTYKKASNKAIKVDL